MSDNITFIPTKTHRKRIVTAILLTLILASPVLFLAGWTFANPGGALTGTRYGPGDSESYLYYVYREGSTTYVKNGTTRAIDSYGSDNTTQIQYAIDQAEALSTQYGDLGGYYSWNPVPGRVVVQGDFILSGSLTFQKPLVFEWYGRAIIGSGDFPAFIIGDTSNRIDKWMKFYVTEIAGAGGSPPTTGAGIEFRHATQNHFEIGRIYGVETGLWFSNDIQGTSDRYITDNHIFFNEIEVCDKAIWFEGSSSVANAPWMEGNEFYGNLFSNHYGIKIDANTKAGVGLFVGVNDNAGYGAGSYDLYDEGQSTGGRSWIFIVKDMRTESTYTYSVNSHTFIQRAIADLTTNRRTESYGTQSVTGAVSSVTVTHYLIGTPDMVVVTPRQDSGDVWVSARTTTTFTISWDGGQPGGSTWYFDFYARYDFP